MGDMRIFSYYLNVMLIQYEGEIQVSTFWC